MKTGLRALLILFTCIVFSCNQSTAPEEQAAATDNGGAQDMIGQSAVVDDVSNPNIVQVASGSADHSTLVAALKAAGLVDALSNAGPFTVFAPVNAGFDKLPAGKLDELLKPENKQDLKNILEYHTYVGSLKTDYFQDGQSYEMVSGQKITISKKGDTFYVNGTAAISSSIPTSNGIIHVINEVLLPK